VTGDEGLSGRLLTRCCYLLVQREM